MGANNGPYVIPYKKTHIQANKKKKFNTAQKL